jgi:hypothetical protein
METAMNRRAVIGLLCCSAALLAAAVPPPGALLEEFEDAPAATARLGLPADGLWRVEQGVLRSPADHAGVASCRLGPDEWDDVDIEFDLRRTRVAAGDQHVGVIVRQSVTEPGQPESALQIFSRGTTFEGLQKPEGEALHITLGELRQPLASGPDAAWTHVRILCAGRTVFVFADQVLVGKMSAVKPRRGGITLYAYNADVEVDHLRLVPLAARAAPVALSPAEASTRTWRAAFDDGLDGVDGAGRRTAPTASAGVEREDGIIGGAATIGRRPGAAAGGATPALDYPTGNLFEHGAVTVMYWFRPDWDGHTWSAAAAGQVPPGAHDLFAVGDAAGREVLRVLTAHAIILKTTNTTGVVSDQNHWAVGNFSRGDWHHLAFVINDRGWNRILLDGLPYLQNDMNGWSRPQLAEVDLAGATTLRLGAAFSSAALSQGSFDELTIVPAALDDDAIAAEYRRCVPLDVVLERRYLRAGAPERLALELHPAGRLPGSPGARLAAGPVRVSLSLTQGADNDRRELAAVQRQVTPGGGLEVVDLPVPALGAGLYTLTCSTEYNGARWRRSFAIVAYAQATPAAPAAPPAATPEPELTVVPGVDVAGFAAAGAVNRKAMADGQAYLEAGERKMDRFSFPLTIPPARLHAGPMVLEVSWPDDRRRVMGLYLYPATTSKRDRDRLAGGVSAGGVSPNSMQLTHTRYLIYPAVDQYLFEARTMVPGCPAAVAAVRLLPAPAPLPALGRAVDTPAPRRRLGHLDEDQSFEYLTSYEDPQRGQPLGLVRMVQALVDELEYTGQDVIAYPLLRYSAAFYNLPGSAYQRHVLAGGYAVPMLLLDMLAARDRSLLGIINLYDLPEISGATHRRAEFEAQGLFLTDSAGQVSTHLDPTHPAVRTLFLSHLGEVLRRFGNHPAFLGLDVWSGGIAPQVFGGLNQGYGDATVGRFEADTGLRLPPLTGATRWAERLRLLTGEHRQAWLAWRAGQVSALYRELAGRVQATDPRLRLYVSVFPPASLLDGTQSECEGLDQATVAYEQQGLDLPALGRVPGLIVVPLRQPTDGVWQTWWDNTLTVNDEFHYRPAVGAGWRRQDEPGLVSSFNKYFESFNDSLTPATVAALFQSADVKPHGRHFLREFAFNLASADAGMLLMGGQPLGVAGRDDETREFAAAFRALPARPFTDLPGLSDPVTVRYLSAPEGVYLYAVNRIWSPATLTVATAAPPGPVVDLASGAERAVTAARFELELKPYQLVSLRWSPGVLPTGGTVTLPAATQEWYAARLGETEALAQAASVDGTERPALAARLAALRSALQVGQYAEAHRLLFSKLLVALPDQAQAAGPGARRPRPLP